LMSSASQSWLYCSISDDGAKLLMRLGTSTISPDDNFMFLLPYGKSLTMSDDTM
jgi:hypothetical protein